MKKELKEARRLEAIRKAHPCRLSIIAWTMVEQWYYGLTGLVSAEGYSYPKFDYTSDDALLSKVFAHIKLMEDAGREALLSYGKVPGEEIRSVEERQCNWMVNYMNDAINNAYPNMRYVDKLIVLTNTLALILWDHWCVTKEPNPAWQKLNQALYDFSWFLIPDENHYLAKFAHEHYMKCSPAMQYDFS